jgi:6-phosphogluconolactonase
MGADQVSEPSKLVRFDGASALTAKLAATVGADLKAALAARGAATLVGSGGRTPLKLLDSLSQVPLDWSQVMVTLADERWVAETDDRSNAKLVRQHLLRDRAAEALFLPLTNDAPSPEQGAAEVEQRLAALPMPIDVVLLGLGEDGHTASWFPGGNHLSEALDPAGPHLVLPMRAPDAPEPRMTLTAPVIATARQLYLQIEGQNKLQTLERALAGQAVTEMPVRYILQNCRRRLSIYWSP